MSMHNIQKSRTLFNRIRMIGILIPLICIFVKVNSYTAIMTVPNIDGKCQIKGSLIDPGKTYYDEEKCEALICRAISEPTSYEMYENGTMKAFYEKEADVNILGCGIALVNKKGKNCHVKKFKGKYPKCCKGPIECH